MPIPEEFARTRDPQKLLREVDAAIKIQDIKRLQSFRDQIQLKWWESGIAILLFISGLGFMITIYKLLPANNPTLSRFVYFWFLLFALTLIATVEFMVAKIHALRQLYEHQARALEKLEKQMTQVRQCIESQQK